MKLLPVGDQIGDGRTDKTKIIGLFSQFCERAKIFLAFCLPYLMHIEC